MGGRASDIIMHNSTVQLFFCAKGLIEMQAHTNSFIFAMVLNLLVLAQAHWHQFD
jgi:hypothetical protein